VADRDDCLFKEACIENRKGCGHGYNGNVGKPDASDEQ
jgi:hypothetical protein